MTCEACDDMGWLPCPCDTDHDCTCPLWECPECNPTEFRRRYLTEQDPM